MYGLKNSFKKISEEIQIPFKISEKDGTIIADLLNEKSGQTIEIKIKMQNEELILETLENYKYCINLLKYCLEQELSNAVKSKEEIIRDLIKGKEFSDEILKEVIKYKPFNLIVMYKENWEEKVIKTIKTKYIEDDSILVSQDKYLVIITKNNVSHERLEGLYNSVARDIYITYCKIDEYGELKEKYTYLKENIEMCLKYNLQPKVYKENSLILERMIKASDKDYIESIYEKYNEDFSKLDKDLIKTIEVFLSEGLKISESAEKLYIHRNTLFYRIEKIKKILNYDISNFNEAIEFKIIFLLWKEIKFRKNF